MNRSNIIDLQKTLKTLNPAGSPLIFAKGIASRREASVEKPFCLFFSPD